MVISFKVKPELKSELQALADSDRRSLSAYVEMVLEDHLRAKARKRGS